MTKHAEFGAAPGTGYRAPIKLRRLTRIAVLVGACLSCSANAVAQGQLQSVGEWLWEHSVGSLWGRFNGQRSIGLYGRVVDQFGQPVENVEIEYAASGSFLASGTGHDRVRTNARGVFVIGGARGLRLVVDGLYKSGYAFRFANGRGRWFEPPTSFPDAEDWRAYSAGNPYPYLIWKIQDRTEKSWKLFEDLTSLSLVPDGRWYSINLKTERGEGLLSKGENPFADMFIAVQRNVGSLTVTLRGNGGGVLPEVDGQGYEAPAHGYQASWTYTTQSLKEESTEHRFYFQSLVSGRKTYGRFTMRLIPVLQPQKPGDAERSGVSINYTTNRLEGRELVTQPWRP